MLADLMTATPELSPLEGDRHHRVWRTWQGRLEPQAQREQ
jgi:hypothetical protein